MRLIIVTGLAGAGKSNVLRSLEDVGYYCCDNLPLPLVPDFVACLGAKGLDRAALSVDSRQVLFLDEYPALVDQLREDGHRIEVLFLEATDAVLERRYSETRRRHPLSGEDVSAGIARDREILSVLRDDAMTIDTDGLNVHELKKIIADRYGSGQDSMAVALQSFGFKHGLPTDLDLVFDVRFLPNPHFDPVLGPLDGRDEGVVDYVFSNDVATDLLDHVDNFLKFVIPQYATEGKLYLTIGVGCTGGRHRSVAVVEELARRLASRWHVLVRHRDVHRGGGSA